MSELIPSNKRALSRSEFQALSDIPPELEWFANIINLNTRRAYKNDVMEFIRFAGLDGFEELRSVQRIHVLGWRKDMEIRELAASTIRRKLSALSALFDFLCEENAVLGNPVHGVKRPSAGSNEGKTPALGTEQAKKLLAAPSKDTLVGLRDRAILAVLLFHGLRRDEVCKLRLKDRQNREGIAHLEVHGKRGKIRYVVLHSYAAEAIDEYMAMSEHGEDRNAPLFQSTRQNSGKPLDSDNIYKRIVKYGNDTGISLEVNGLCTHSMRTTAATNALLNNADLAMVQAWLGHSDISTTKLYDRRKMRPEDSPTNRVKY